MKKTQIINIIFFTILTLTFFSLWAGFALLVVNKHFHSDLVGYKIGQLCIWEFVALIISIIIAIIIKRKWGSVKLTKTDRDHFFMFNPKYGIYFALYFLVAVLVGVWQFWLFSQTF